jgi:hypothetical protein
VHAELDGLSTTGSRSPAIPGLPYPSRKSWTGATRKKSANVDPHRAVTANIEASRLVGLKNAWHAV